MGRIHTNDINKHIDITVVVNGNACKHVVDKSDREEEVLILTSLKHI